MNKQQAVAAVAASAAGWLQSCTLAEALGMTEAEVDKLSDADVGRLGDAVETVVQRLHRMGGDR